MITATMTGKSTAATNVVNDHHVRGTGRYHIPASALAATTNVMATTPAALGTRMLLSGLMHAANHAWSRRDPIEPGRDAFGRLMDDLTGLWEAALVSRRSSAVRRRWRFWTGTCDAGDRSDTDRRERSSPRILPRRSTRRSRAGAPCWETGPDLVFLCRGGGI
jgi:hypothetical protein